MSKRKKMAISFLAILCVAGIVFLCVHFAILAGRMTFKASDEMLGGIKGKYTYTWIPGLYKTLVIGDGESYIYTHDPDYGEEITPISIRCNPGDGTFDIVYDDNSFSKVIVLKSGDIIYQDRTYEKLR